MATSILGLVLLLACGATQRVGQWTLHDERRDDSVRVEVSRVLSKAQREIEAVLGLHIRGPGTVVLCASAESFHKATPGFDHRHTLGVAMPSRRVIFLNCEVIQQAHLEQVALTLRHELCHIVMGEVAARTGQPVPLWFNEGVAVWLGGKIPRYDPSIFRMRAAAGMLPPLKSLERWFPEQQVERGVAYELSESFIRALADEHGDGVIRSILQAAAAGARFEAAFEQATGTSLAEAEAAWRKSLRPGWPVLTWIANAFSLFTGIALLALVSFAVYWRRRRRKYEEWERDEFCDPGF